MAPGPGEAAFRPHWLLLPLEQYLGSTSVPVPTRIGLHVEGATFAVLAHPDGVSIEVAATGPFDAELTAAAPLLLALVSGARSLDEVLGAGATLAGDGARLEGILAAAHGSSDVVSSGA